MPRHFAVISATLTLSAIFAAALVAQAYYQSNTASLSPERTARLVRQAAVSPHINVWAWERDEDLSYIDPSKIVVAYFAGNIYVRGSNVSFRPRTQKLKLPANAETIPVFRIESVRTDDSIPEASAAAFVSKTILKTVKKSSQNSKVIQIDFDALEDERPFYKSLLAELRKELPRDIKISMTALASWLLGDTWLEPGSVDETVAMLFSIGPERNDVLSRLSKQPLSNGAGIPVAIGISAGEADTNRILFQTNILRKSKNLYIFSSRPWTEQRLRAITKEALAR